jgi:hypothetical protein
MFSMKYTLMSQIAMWCVAFVLVGTICCFSAKHAALMSKNKD